MSKFRSIALIFFIYPACKSCLERMCPSLYRFLWSNYNEYRGIKFVLGTLFGASLGIGNWAHIHGVPHKKN